MTEERDNYIDNTDTLGTIMEEDNDLLFETNSAEFEPFSTNTLEYELFDENSIESEVFDKTSLCITSSCSLKETNNKNYCKICRANIRSTLELVDLILKPSIQKIGIN
ncbi:33179_t:CDS:2, partial [Gigaspora margarita]